MNQVGNTRESLSIIFSFQGFIVFIEVGDVVLHLFNLVGSGLRFLFGVGLFQGCKSFLKFKKLDKSSGFFFDGLDIVGVKT